jgi:hypothetical protein
MSQHEHANSRSQASVSLMRLEPIDERPEDLDSIREKIRMGQAFLKVVEYPWGVEFDVVSVEGRQ